MTAFEAYERYSIMPNLREHQLRVAAVALQICQASPRLVNTAAIMKACLIHDMGNILKFDLDAFPDFTQAEGRAHWQRVQDDFTARYGHNEHVATITIAKEIGVSAAITECIELIGFTRATAAANSGSLDAMICCYADQRVAPKGVVSLADRLQEGRVRYAGRPGYDMASSAYDSLVEHLDLIERTIFAGASLQPDQINDDSIRTELEPLLTTVLP